MYVVIDMGVVLSHRLPSMLAALIDAFCTYASRGSANRANLRLHEFVRSPDGTFRHSSLVLGNFLGSHQEISTGLRESYGAVGEASEASWPLGLCAGPARELV